MVAPEPPVRKKRSSKKSRSRERSGSTSDISPCGELLQSSESFSCEEQAPIKERIDVAHEPDKRSRQLVTGKNGVSEPADQSSSGSFVSGEVRRYTQDLLNVESPGPAAKAKTRR